MKSSKKKIKSTIKKSKKLSTSLNQINNLYKELEKNNNDYEKMLLKPGIKYKEEDKLLKDIEETRIKLSKIEKSYFPSIYSDNFAERIFNITDFNISQIDKNEEKLRGLYKEYDDIKKKSKKNIKKTLKEGQKQTKKSFQLSNTQIFLKKFLSKKTPYRGMLIFHDTGVGKTCSAITIAENLKHIIKSFGKKVYIVRYEEFKSQIFDNSLLHKGNIKLQCTKDTYKKELIASNKEEELSFKNCKKNPIYCESLMVKINKLIKKYYEFKNVEKFARDVDKVINKQNKYQTKEEAHQEKINEIKKQFSDSLIIIDEAHHINDLSSDADSKLISNVLTDILKYGDNIRLILLSATPLWDRTTDIVSLVNFLLINDRRPILKTNQIFNSDGSLKNEKELRKKVKGYVSFLRGNNPFTFPIRLNCSINIPKLIIKKYPTKGFDKETTFYKNKIKFETFDIIDCEMKDNQKEIYKKAMELKKSKEDISSVYSTETQISNFVYQSYKDSKQDINICYGENGFNSIFNKTKNGTYRFKKEEYGKNFIGENLKQFSNKIYILLQNIKKSKGPAFVFSKLVWGGLFPVIIALEMNGYKLYDSTLPMIENKYKVIDNNLGEFIIKSGSIKSKNIKNYISKKEKMIEEPVKVFLGTETASEGLNLFGYREVHILEPHFNFSLLEQVIGRTTRNKSHLSLPINKRNVTIYTYASTFGKEESVDLLKYRISQEKAYKIGDITKLLKEESIDCLLNYYGNNLIYDEFKNRNVEMVSSHQIKISIPLTDQPYSKFCDYKKECEYKCKGNLKIKAKNDILLINNVDKIIERYKGEIIELVVANYIIKIDDLIKQLKIKSKELYQIAILSILQEDKVYTGINEKGKIILNNNFLKFVKIDSNDKDIELIDQYYKKKKYIDEIDITYFLNKLKIKEVKKIIININKYDKILKKIEFNLENVKNNIYIKDSFFTNLIKLEDIEIIEFLFNKLMYVEKVNICQTIILKIIKKEKLTENEDILLEFIKKNFIVYNKELKNISSSNKEIYGFILSNYKELIIYKFIEDSFEIDIAYNMKIIKNKIRTMKIDKLKLNNIYSYHCVDYVNGQLEFKIVDSSFKNIKSQTGSKCIDKSKVLIKKYYEMIMKTKFKKIKKNYLCNELEILFKRQNKDSSVRWYLNDIEYLLLTEYFK